MKKVALYIVAVVSCFFLVGCFNQKVTTYNIEPLSTSDFALINEETVIELGTLYSTFTATQTQDVLESHYVGEIFSEDIAYKTYMYQYTDFDLYVSNMNYDIKNRNFDDYYITQINLKSPEFQSARGITLGSTVNQIFDAYGPVETLEIEGKTVLTYKYDDMQMSYTLDQNEAVQAVVFGFKPSDTSSDIPLELLYGDWISSSDTKYQIKLNKNTYSDFYDGSLMLQTDYALLETCPGNLAKSNYLSLHMDGEQHCYEILSLTDTHLSLLYLDRGNILTFTRNLLH